MKKVEKLVKIWKAGKYKIIPNIHPDAGRSYKISVKKSYKNKKRMNIRAKQFWKRMCIVFKTKYDPFNEDACMACSCKKSNYCKNCKFKDKTLFSEVKYEW